MESEIGFFGGEKFDLIEEQKTKLNLFDEFKQVLNGKVPEETLLVPLLNWYSNEKLNIQQMQNINKQFFWVSKDILSRQMVLNINRYKTYIKYPKKGEEEELEFLIPYICKYYKWSEREFNFNRELIDLKDENLHKELDKLFAFEKDELRKLGIKREKIEAKFEKVIKTKGFF